MRKLLIFVLGFSFCATASPVRAAKFDGSVPLLCVPVQITECDAGGRCYQGTAEDVNLPQFIKINVREKMLSGVDEAPRTTPIDYLEREGGKLVLHGGQDGKGWTVVISEETGKLAATISEERTGFIVFGACTTL